MTKGPSVQDRRAHARVALTTLAVSLTLVGCGHQPTGQPTSPTSPPTGTPSTRNQPPVEPDQVLSVSAQSAYALYTPCHLAPVVTVSPDDTVTVTWAPAPGSGSCPDDGAAPPAEQSGQAPDGTFDQIVGLVTAAPYASLGPQLSCDDAPNDASYRYVAVELANTPNPDWPDEPYGAAGPVRSETKGGYMADWCLSAFGDVYHAVWDAADAAGLNA